MFAQTVVLHLRSHNVWNWGLSFLSDSVFENTEFSLLWLNIDADFTVDRKACPFSSGGIINLFELALTLFCFQASNCWWCIMPCSAFPHCNPTLMSCTSHSLCTVLGTFFFPLLFFSSQVQFDISILCAHFLALVLSHSTFHQFPAFLFQPPFYSFTILFSIGFWKRIFF